MPDKTFMKTVAPPKMKLKLQTVVKKMPTVAVSIVTWNSSAEIGECLLALADLPENWEVWVVDNNSADATVEIVRNEFPFVKLIANPDNKGFAEANNQVINQTETDYVLLLNPDTRAAVRGLERSLEIIEENPQIGLLGVRLCNDDGTLQTTCFHFPTAWKNYVDAVGLERLYSKEKIEEMFAGDYFAHDEPRPVDWVKGAFMLARRAAIEKAGAVPEDYFMFAEDLDFCWQISQSGYQIWFSPEVSVIHKSNKSAGQLPSNWRVERTTLSKYLFCLKNFGSFKGRFIQLTDLIGVNYKIFRRSLKDPKSTDIAEWKRSRREIFRSVFMSRGQIRAKLHER
jgi:GT2 family glycosyltransferase